MSFSKHWKSRAPIFQSLENPHTAVAFLGGLFACVLSVHSQTTLLDAHEQVHLTNALACLGMTVVDLEFDKDLGKPDVVLAENRRLLAEPLRIAERGAACLGAVTNGAVAIWEWAAPSLGMAGSNAPLGKAAAEERSDGKFVRSLSQASELDPTLLAAIELFLRGADRARRVLDRAFEGISRADRAYAAAALLADFFRLEDFPERRVALEATGASSQALTRVLLEADDIDPEPEAKAFLEIARKMDLGAVLQAGRLFYEATRELAVGASKVTAWPDRVVRLKTPLGILLVGTRANDRYDEATLLIVDPSGDEVYRNGAGTANGLSGSPLSAIVDGEGDDRYRGTGVVGAGTAMFGVSVLFDEAGDDVYESDGLGQGAALFGAAWLEDGAGADLYRAAVCAQGAAWCGFGVLRDLGGADRYNVGLCGQGYAGVLGVGLLADADGNDGYFAGGREPDFERNDDRYFSLAQGFAIGWRPFAGGGVAALVDLKGNDVYVADVYGQGVSYWYSLGMLLDVEGNDRYLVHQYGQGAGIHLSSGLLADFDGDDSYAGAILVQGCAHDYGVGLLLEKGGCDTYVGRQHAQGRALNNALALLLDARGDDSYFAGRCDECQGIGNDGDKREYGSLALLLDLKGRDHYSCGARDGARMERPDFGIVYDFEAEEDEQP